MTLAVLIRPILKFRARMQHDMIVEQLDITRLEHHGEAEGIARCQLVKTVYGLDLLFRKPGCIGEGLRVQDLFSDIATANFAVLKRKQRLQVPRCYTFRLLAIPAPG